MTASQRELGRTKLRVSPIGLGTAEIGFVYGLKNTQLPSEEDAVRLLQEAVNCGITFFDTAHIYGLSEERIARSGILKDDRIVVTTKCGHLMDKTDAFDPEAVVQDMRAEVEESLRRLEIERIPLLQIHGASAASIRKGFIQSMMRELQQEGKVQYVGISVRGEEAAMAALEDGTFDALQLAHSILDQRMAGRVFSEAKRQNVGIINRSVLLKGVLTGNPQELPEGLSALRENSGRALAISKAAGMDLPTLSIRFALSNPAVDTVLVGSSKIRNVESAVAAAALGPLPDDILLALRELAIADPRVVDPSLWRY